MKNAGGLIVSVHILEILNNIIRKNDICTVSLNFDLWCNKTCPLTVEWPIFKKCTNTFKLIGSIKKKENCEKRKCQEAENAKPS